MTPYFVCMAVWLGVFGNLRMGRYHCVGPGVACDVTVSGPAAWETPEPGVGVEVCGDSPIYPIMATGWRD